MPDRHGLLAAAPRLIAEFLVISIGVLVALGADQWVQSLEDRELESEYLDRLWADVGYDREEVDFVQAVSRAGLIATDSLLTPGFTDRVSDDEVLSAALLAGTARQVDLSRGTWQELVASGRIALLRDPEVRLALADYDRFVGEIAGFWEYTENDLLSWVIRRVPAEATDQWASSCFEDDGSTRFSTSQSTTACAFDIGPGSADGVRAEVGTHEAVGELRLQRNRYRGLLNILTALRERVDALERVLENAR